MNRKPIPTPCQTPVIINVVKLTSELNFDISHSDAAVIDSPVSSSSRASMRLTSRPTMNIDSIVPKPRGASTQPVVITG